MSSKAPSRKREPARLLTPPPPPQSGAWLRDWVFRPRTLVAAALALAAAILLPSAGRLLPRLDDQPLYQYRLAELRLTPPHAWAPQDIVGQVLATNAFPETVSLLDESLVKRVTEAFARHPWIARVTAVRKGVASGVQVDVVYRTPVAMVEMKRGLYPVDGEGTLLPPVDFSLADAQRLPLIRGILTTPQGPAGMQWGDDAVVGAARLAALLAPGQDLDRYWKPFGLAAILSPPPLSATDTVDDFVYELESAAGSRIVWGRTIGADSLEPTPEQKLGRMEQYVSSYGGFDKPHGPYRIDIRHFDRITLQRVDGQEIR